LVKPENIPQLILTHLQGSDVKEFKIGALTINWHLRNQIPIMVLALLGAIFAYQKKMWGFLYPLAWMLIAYILLLNHTPVWDHQQLLVTIPATMLASFAVTDILSLIPVHSLIHWVGQSQWYVKIGGILTVFFLFFGFRIPAGFEYMRAFLSSSKFDIEISVQEARILNEVSNYASQTNWIVTDLPMYAYRARIPVPPNLSAFTVKRFLTGNLTEYEIIEIIKEYQPEQVLLGRRSYEILEQYLEENYNLIRMEDFGPVPLKLFLRRDL